MSNITVPAPIDRVVAAVNSGDNDAFVAQFTSDGVIDDWGSRYTDRAAILAWLKREVTGVKQTWTVTKVESKGDHVTITANVGGGGFNGPSHFSFTLKDGHVKEMKITE